MKISGSKFLVTGGTGFIGRALVGSLLRKGAHVRSLDNDSRGSRSKLAALQDQVELINGDICELDTVRRAVRGMDAVCHLAYINGTDFFYTKPEIILEVAVKGMMNVIDACIAENIPQLILASSSEVYQQAPVIPTDESAPLVVPDVLNPRYSYGGGKIISELLLVNYGRRYFERAMIFRPHNVYGPDMGQGHVIPQFAERMKELFSGTQGMMEFPIQGNGEETRSFIYIDDFSESLMRVIESGEHLNIYHLGTEQEISIRDLAEKMASCWGRTIKIVPGELRAGSTLRRCPDIGKLKKLGFEPSIPIIEGLRRTISWHRQAPA